MAISKALKSKLKALIVEVVDPGTSQQEAIKSFHETEALVRTIRGEVVHKTIQHHVNPDPATYIGSGKVHEIKKLVGEKNIQLIILNAVVNPAQIFRLEKNLWNTNPNIIVWDRVDLILEVFDRHASSTEAKLQIEVAQLNHIGPRVHGLGGDFFSRQAGGIGARGAGESNIEVMRRHIKNHRRKLQIKLKKASKSQQYAIDNRRKKGFYTVSLIGYTNSGKTSLFNLLTGKNKEIKNDYFTTLDSYVGKLTYGKNMNKILITDTIGFIEKLPPSLIKAFQSTLMESTKADILLHVVDVSDPKSADKIKVVNEILNELKIDKSKILTVLNKSDLLSNENKNMVVESIKNSHNISVISVIKNEGVSEIISSVISQLSD